ncbi:hypothetical protein [Actinomadura sp. 3N508]|uniref:hypothetical protein n=1 Tax=Actinomadura sp. 3N508 TaxID=3375153 RepID=UPI00379B18A1
MTIKELGEVVIWVGGVAAAVAAIGFLLRGAWRTNRRFVRIADAVTELSPNSGHSIKDTVDRIETKVDGLDERLTQHINHHPGGTN